MLIASNNDKLSLNNSRFKRRLLYINLHPLHRDDGTNASGCIRSRGKQTDFRHLDFFSLCFKFQRNKSWAKVKIFLDIDVYTTNREMSNITIPQKLPSANVRIVFIFFKCLYCIVGILGNACVIIYNIFFNHSKTPTSYFVVKLAIIDFLSAL